MLSRSGRVFAASVGALSIVLAATVAMPVATAQPLAWGSCAEWLDTSDAPTAQCGTFTVPVDWDGAADPQSAQAHLAVIRVPARGRRLGILMMNPGGPGASAVEFVRDYIARTPNSALLQHFDIVGFDPRGVGFSEPGLDCLTDAERDALRRDPQVDYSPAGVTHIEDQRRRFVQACLDHMGAAFLAGMSTATTARDMDALRAALGEEQITYVGMSYGTMLGIVYGEMFPNRVRAALLDGVEDPQVDPIADDLAQDTAFQQAFDEFARTCAQLSDCPLGADPARSVARFHDLIDPLVNQRGHTKDPRGLGHSDAIAATEYALYGQDDWPALNAGLRALRDGKPADDLLELADVFLGRDTAGHYGPEWNVLAATQCVDVAYPGDPAVWVDFDRRVREAAPFESYGSFTGFAPRDQCVFWPVRPAAAPQPASWPGPGKVMVISTTGDPATPYQVGVEVAAELGAPLLTFEGTQHTAFIPGTPCVRAAGDAFLIDLRAPDPGQRC